MKRLIIVLIVVVLAAIGIYYYLSSGEEAGNENVDSSATPASVAEPLKKDQAEEDMNAKESKDQVADKKGEENIPDLESLEGLEEESEKLLDDPLKDVIQ